MPRRDPYLVLGVSPDASLANIKAAWRKLARRHHPDLTVGDAAASRAATKQMAEINAAYEELRDPERRRAAAARAARPARPARAGGHDDQRRRPGTPGNGGERPFEARSGRGNGAGGPPVSRPGRPVTARLDTTETFRPRNQTTTPRGRAAYPPGQAPLRSRSTDREPPRASDPTGPLHRARMRRFRKPVPPELADALAMDMTFGKFRGHTLGEIADFEPSYVDWISQTITRDPDLVAAARVIRDELDRRGVVRRGHAHPPGRGRPI